MAGVALSNAYNHYLTTYAPKDVTQNAHKRDDLRNIYKSIVKSSQNTPIYLLKVGDGTQESAIGLKENARMLQNTLSSAHDISDENILGQRTAYSSMEDAVSAKYIGEDGDSPPTFKLDVQHLAEGQVNQGSFLPNRPTELAPGSYSFDARVNDQSYEFQFSIRSTETNLDIQERLARLINKSNIGLQAQILTGDSGGTALQISSNTTGLGAGKTEQFTISEGTTGQNTGTVSYFGLDQIAQEASDAIFTVDGNSYSSSSNRFTLSSTYELSLHSTTDGEIEIGVKNRNESVYDHIHSIIDGYNQFLDSVSGISAPRFQTGRVLGETSGIASSTLAGMDEAGIHIEEDGRVTLDDARLKRTTEADNTEELLPLREFANALLDKAKSISLDPMQYVTQPVVAYRNPGREFPNPYMTSEYSGMLFSNYC